MDDPAQCMMMDTLHSILLHCMFPTSSPRARMLMDSQCYILLHCMFPTSSPRAKMLMDTAPSILPHCMFPTSSSRAKILMDTQCSILLHCMFPTSSIRARMFNGSILLHCMFQTSLPRARMFRRCSEEGWKLSSVPARCNILASRRKDVLTGGDGAELRPAGGAAWRWHLASARTKIDSLFHSNAQEYDRGDSFPSDYEPYGIVIGSYSKGKPVTKTVFR